MSDIKSVVWVASFPKSGNTWMHTILQRLGNRHGVEVGTIDVYKLFYTRTRPAYFPFCRHDADDRSVILKTHAKFDDLSDHAKLHPGLLAELGLAAPTAGFCLITRNPLDVLLSYINYTRLEYREGHKSTNQTYQDMVFRELLGMGQVPQADAWYFQTLDSIDRRALNHALEVFTENEGVIPSLRDMSGSWFDHTNSWLRAGDSVRSVVLRYEDLTRASRYFAPLTTLFRFEQHEIHEVVEAIRERNEKFRNETHSENNVFYNKMRPYYFRDYFDAGLVRRFCETFGDRLIASGYGDIVRDA